MQCMKCGKETVSQQIFCEQCLLNMQAYPIKPGTVVNLPRQKPAAESKKASARKRPSNVDEQITNLQKHLRRARIIAIVLATLLLASSGMLMYEIMNPDGPVIGLNYTIDTTMGND